MNRALRLSDYLGHILSAIERIERHTAQIDENAFLHSELMQDAVIRNLEVIGEAAKNIQRVDPAFADLHANIPCRWYMRCTTACPTAMTQWTMKWFGGRFAMTSLKSTA